MSLVKKVLLPLLAVFILIQFIQPAHNKSTQIMSTDITKIYNVPDNVQIALKNACYDCHSNNTSYPWYSNMQPMAWLMANHIKNGKAELNFSEFGLYTTRRQKSKLKSIASQINDGEMPLSSYMLMHKNANLSKDEKALIINWAMKTKDSLSAK
ncbi:cytochrome C [Ilyomonas limi]|uniref:Cytochrome C n=1 Tax=Ilyomonas limi TaxID=2575867 RepID=A0A4U3KWR7_9BACT|nr:heme-binding domain-containing protein [Ilyomonas limi]TKK66289.1 cytochrome C [Ilyomonas limi]